MRTPAARAGLAFVALAVVVALFVVLAGDDDAGTDATTTQLQSAKGATGGRSRKPRTPTVERIVLRGGKPVRGVKRLQYKSGERVRFSVRSDVADEVHVHGFDIQKDVSAGGSVRFGFPADIEGIFEVELEHRKIEIARLRVKP